MNPEETKQKARDFVNSIFKNKDVRYNYKPVAKLDRGAEAPDKSWFGIAKKNADAIGFDKRMTEVISRLITWTTFKSNMLSF